MNIQLNRNGSTITLNVEGEIDECGAEILKNRFRDVAASGARNIFVNFSKVSHIGSAGIGKILVFYKDLAIRDATLALEQVPDHIYHMLREMKLDTIFSISCQSNSR